MNQFYVYVLFRPNGIPCYVGKGKGRRSRKHFIATTNPHLANIIRNADVELPVIHFREDLSEDAAFELERVLIKSIGREINGGPLVNMTDGGEGISGFKMPPEIIERVSRIHVGNKYCLGRELSAETREKQRLKKLGTRQSPEHSAAIGRAHRGRTRPAETGRRITAAKTGKKASDATRAALRAGNRSRDPAVRAKISAAVRAQVAYRRQLLLMIA